MNQQPRLPLFPKVMPKWFWPLVIAVCISLVSFILVLAVTMFRLRRGPVVVAALEYCQNRPEVRVRLGQELSVGLVVLGESGENAEGETVASRLFRVEGEQGFASCRTYGIQLQDGSWELQVLQLFYEGDQNSEDSDWVTLLGDPDDLPQNLSDVRRERVREEGMPHVPFTNTGPMTQEELQREAEQTEELSP